MEPQKPSPKSTKLTQSIKPPNKQSYPPKPVTSKHEVTNLNNTRGNQYPITDIGALIVLYTLAILGAWYNISPTADKTYELLRSCYCLRIPLCIQLSRKLRKKYFPGYGSSLIRSPSLCLKISLIGFLFWSKSKHRKSSLTSTTPWKLSFVKELFRTKCYLMVWPTMNSPKMNLIKRHLLSAWEI